MQIVIFSNLSTRKLLPLKHRPLVGVWKPQHLRFGILERWHMCDNVYNKMSRKMYMYSAVYPQVS
jgi:hypothetical protein